MKYLYIYYITLVLLAAYGWVWNVIDVVHLATGGSSVTAMFILRVVGIFLGPLGVVLGYV